MKRTSLLSHMRRHGCVLKRESRICDLWINASSGQMVAVPRRNDISDRMTNIICRFLNIPQIPPKLF